MLAVEWRIRPGRKEDSQAAAGVVRTVFAEYGFTWDEHGYHADLADVEAGFDAFWVAEEVGGRVVGCAGLRRREAGLGGAEGSLERLYVLAEARGTGLGSALLAAVVEGARARGWERLEIWSDKLFEDAHRLYGRRGAVVVAERVNDDPDESAEWGLVLEVGANGGDCPRM